VWIYADLNFLSVSSFNFSSVLCNALKSAKSLEFIFMFDWFNRNADWRVQVDNCCQRAKVHRLVTLPEQSCKMSWSCCGIFFSGVCVNFEYLEIWIHYFSKSNSAHHYFSKSNSAHHYLISSKCKQLLFFISKCKPALIFCSSRYETVSNCCFKTISYLFIILGIFDYVSNAISNYVQNF